MRVTYLAIAEIIHLTLRPAITAHGHPAGIDDCPTLLSLMPDDGRQHAKRDIRYCTYADVMHDEVKKHIHPGTDFGHAVLSHCRQGGGRGPDTDHVAGKPRRAQAFSGANAARPLGFSHRLQCLGGIEVVA